MNQYPLIGLCGRRQAGKDTLAKYLCRERDYWRVAFADRLKEELWIATGMGRNMSLPAWMEYLDSHKEDPEHWSRPLLQVWGQMRRQFNGPDYWIDQVRERLIPGTVVSDCRHRNEERAIHDGGGVLIRIERRRTQLDSYLDKHESEAQVEALNVDYVIFNDRAPEDMFRLADALFRRWAQQEASPAADRATAELSGPLVLDPHSGGVRAYRLATKRTDGERQ